MIESFGYMARRCSSRDLRLPDLARSSSRHRAILDHAVASPVHRGDGGDAAADGGHGQHHVPHRTHHADGVVTKNAILLVDYAKVLHRGGGADRGGDHGGQDEAAAHPDDDAPMISGCSPGAGIGAGAEERAPMRGPSSGSGHVDLPHAARRAGRLHAAGRLRRLDAAAMGGEEGRAGAVVGLLILLQGSCPRPRQRSPPTLPTPRRGSPDTRRRGPDHYREQPGHPQRPWSCATPWKGSTSRSVRRPAQLVGSPEDREAGPPPRKRSASPREHHGGRSTRCDPALVHGGR